MIGAGKYDEECTKLRENTKAKGVIIMVVDGNKGEGFSVQATPDVMPSLPAILRKIADDMEANIKELMG